MLHSAALSSRGHKHGINQTGIIKYFYLFSRGMEIKDSITRVEKSDEFTYWFHEREDHFLAHVFRLLDKENENIWQVGYCNPANDCITTFFLEGDTITCAKEAEVLRKPSTHLRRLDISAVSIGHEEALKAAEKRRAEKYPKESTLKSFFILQDIGNGAIYNVTFFTSGFKAINIRVSAETGDIQSDQIADFFKMG